MELVEKSSGKLVDVPDEQVPAAYRSGQYGLQKGKDVATVGSDGRVGMVRPEEAGAAFEAGERIASGDQVHAAQLEARYGGLGMGLAAVGEGAARGLSLGLSDPLAVGAARMFGGDETAEHVREHLAGVKEARPYLSGAGEFLGAAAPIALSGGAAAPEAALMEGAGGALREASVLGRIGEGVRTLGLAPRAAAGAGDAFEHAVASVLGTEAETAIGRAAQSAAKTAARGLAEAGIFGAGDAISDATLKDEPLTAEKLFASVGHAAMMGGALGGALAGVGRLAAEGAGSVLTKASPLLEKASAEQAYRWLDARVGVSREAVARAGGTEAVGNTVLERVMKPLVEKEGIRALAMDPTEKLAAVRKAVGDLGGEIGDLVKGNAHAATSLGEVLRPIDDQIAHWDKQVLGAEKVAPLQKLRSSIVEMFRAPEEEAIAGAPVARTPQEVAEYLRTNPAAAQELAATGRMPQAAAFREGPMAAPPMPVDTARPVSIEELIKVRRGLQDRVYEDIKALDPDRRTKVLREVTGAWNELEERVLNEASKGEGELAGSRLRDLNKEYQRLKLAEQAIQETTSRYATNRNLGMSEYLAGIEPGMHALLTGHPMGAVLGVGAALAHKQLREHANGYAAILFDRLSTWGGTARAANEVTEQVDHAIAKAVSGAARKAGRESARGARPDMSEVRFEAERRRIEQIAALAPAVADAHLKQRTAPVSLHAPGLAAQLQRQAKVANDFLVSKLPPQAPPNSLTPQLQKHAVSLPDRTKFLRYVDAVEGGPAHVLEKMAAGKLTMQDVEAGDAVFPRMMQEIRAKVALACSERKTPLEYQRRCQLGILLNMATDPSLEGPFVAAMQESYRQNPNGSEGPPQPSVGSAPSKLSLAEGLATPFDRGAAT